MPSLVSLRSLKVAAPDGTPLVEDLTLSLGPQRYGLVGRNGSGKSTLLRVLAGEIAPAAGSAHVAGSVGWLRQQTDPAEGSVARALGVAEGLARLERMLRGEGTADDVAAADWTLEERLAEALSRVGLTGTDWRRPVDTLSGGQRTRLAVARVLIEAPEILLLDEPTNNLDADGRALVAGLVRDWRGCVVVASHDRALLGGVDAIVEIGNGSARLFGGAWPAFAAARAARIETAVATLHQAEREARRIARGAQAQRERQARRDSRGRADRARGDAPKTLFDARQDWAERTAGRGNRIAERKQAETAAALATARAEVEVLAPLRIAVPDAVRPGDRTLLVCEAVTVDAGGKRVLGPIDLKVTATDRLALTGPNGSGKSTLLRIAAGVVAPGTGSVWRAAGRVALLDQQVAFLRDEDRLIDAMRRMNPTLTNEEAHAALARFAFRNAAAEKHCHGLSGGERMRAGLACILSGSEAPALLLLDEPTNHMDIDSVEVLEAALADYRGALVVASHDRAFLEGIGVGTEFALAAQVV